MDVEILLRSNVVKKCQTVMKLQADTRDLPSPYYNDIQLQYKPPQTTSVIGVASKHQTQLLLRRTCKLCLRSGNRCITEPTHHSWHELAARTRTNLPKSVPREAAEGHFQDTCVRRRYRELSGRSTNVGVAVQSLSIAAGCGRMAGLAYIVAAVVLKHMQLGLFLVFGPIMRSRFE
jgi:hypothetical protein